VLFLLSFNVLSALVLSVVMIRAFRTSVTMLEVVALNVVMQRAFVIRVIMLRVIILNAVMLSHCVECHYTKYLGAKM
jgi:hypothetical protein